MTGKLILGCIADDFTGASDAASFLVKGGMQTLLFNGVPDDENKTKDVDAIVIALKTRTQEAGCAVRESLSAVQWLKKQGARQLYIKYCSTFDSTSEGNIGPIVDAVMKLYGGKYTILCPALPINGRTVKDGCLFVNGILLAESPMKDHPLTPMSESDITKLMQLQSKYPCIKMSSEELAAGNVAVYKMLNALSKKWNAFYIVPDLVDVVDTKHIVGLFGNLPVLTGGSGLMTALAEYHMKGKTIDNGLPTATKGAGIVLAGSCSKATLAQIKYYQNRGGISFKLNPLKILQGRQNFADVWTFIQARQEKEVLIYSSESPQFLDSIRETTLNEFSRVLEKMMASIAKCALENGFKRIIVAGGETSGAVTKELGFDSYWIGESVAPGVPVMIPCAKDDVRLILKSGNFGQEDFFEWALEMTKK